MPEPRRLLLLGSGPNHLEALARWADKPLPPGTELRWVSAAPQAAWPGCVPDVLAGRRRPAEALVALPPLAARAGALWTEGRATGLDATARRLTLADGRVFGYELLSLDLAGAPDRESLAGARDHALALWPLEPFLALQDRLVELAAGRVIDLVVIGGGADAVETALALAARLAAPDEERARIALVAPPGELLPGQPEAVLGRVRRLLARRRITEFQDRVVALDGHQARLASGARLACDAAVLATAPQPWAALANSGLALAANGEAAAGPTGQSPSHPEVLVAGRGADRAVALQRLLLGGTPGFRATPATAPLLLATGDGGALAQVGGFSLEGRLPGWWREWRLRRWLERLAPVAAAGPALTRPAGS